MRYFQFALCVIALAASVRSAEPAAPSKDSVTITTHSAVGARTSPGASMPDRIGMRLEVQYVLASEREAVVSLALDDGQDMAFSTFDSAPVSKGAGAVDLRAGVRMIHRPVLHCLVIMKKKNAKPADAPLAVTGITIDVKGLTKQ